MDKGAAAGARMGLQTRGEQLVNDHPTLPPRFLTNRFKCDSFQPGPVLFKRV
jgi:hypothetical protein